jgi:hypothetical protein
MLKCGALVCGILVAATCERGVARSEYRSPTNEYSVRLTSGGAGPFWLEQAVWATAARRTSPLGTDLEIHTADFMDSTFEQTYSHRQRTWVAENILRLPSLKRGRLPSGAVTPGDKITLVNRSGREIGLLAVNAGDLFLVLDVGNGATAKFESLAQSSAGDFSWIAVRGQWKDGSTVPHEGRNFSLPRRSRAGFEYTITATASGFTFAEASGAAIAR